MGKHEVSVFAPHAEVTRTCNRTLGTADTHSLSKYESIVV